MLYIKFTKDYFKEFKKQDKFPKIINGIIYFWKIMTGGFFKETTQNGEIIILPRLNRKTKDKLINYLKVYSVKTICLAENLKNTDLEEKIKSLNIKILDGKWLYSYLIQNIVGYIISQKNSMINTQEISILSRKITELDIENIKMLAEKCKLMNVITGNELRIKRLEEHLYNEKGIILNVTNNYLKALSKSDIIINMDFDEEEFNKYVFSRKAVIINVKNPVKVLYKGFDGMNIFSYKINIPQKYINSNLDLNDFNEEILYESFLYKTTNPRNIIKEIEADDMKIEYLIGSKGEIKKNEFYRLQPTRR